MPVQGQIPTTLLPFFKQIPPFNCLCSRYEGPWEGLMTEYSEMLDYIAFNDLEMTDLYVETLLHIDFAAPACQLTEIQIGLCSGRPGAKGGAAAGPGRDMLRGFSAVRRSIRL